MRSANITKSINQWGGMTICGFSTSKYNPLKSRLNDILQENVPEKYYLSQKACLGIMRRAEKRGKELPTILKEALEHQAQITSQDSIITKKRISKENGTLPTLSGSDENGDITEVDYILFEPRSQDGTPRIHNNVCPTLNTAQGGQRQPRIVTENKVYSFDSLASNSMKSKNPHSGCREVNVAKTLDTSSQCPSKNQGGIAVLDKVYGFSPDNSITTGGVTCEEEKTATLSATKKMGVVTLRDTSGTLRANTGAAKHESDWESLIITSPVIINDQGGSSINVEKEDVSPTLRSEAHGNQPIVAFTCNQRDEVRDLKDCAGALQAHPGMKQQTFCIQGNMIGRNDKNGPQGNGINEDISFTLNATDRHAIAFGEADLHNYKQNRVSTLKSSSRCIGGGSETLIAGIDCRNGRENGDLCGTLQAKENGGFSYNCTHPVRIGNIVRRLTPTEFARLQGFPDWWCADVPHADTAEYKMWGNGMALPCVLYIMQNIALVADDAN